MTDGMNVDGYEQVETLTTQGFVHIVKARHNQSGAFVALKFIEKVDTISQIQARNLLEAGAALKKRPHPNLCSVVEMRSSDEFVFVAYEWLEAESLLEALSRGMGLESIKKIFLGIGTALVHLRDLGILHGDIKPSKVFLRGNGSPVLVDVAGGSFDDRDLIQSKYTKGYGSPEATKGIAVNDSSDVFSFGVLLYRVLVGDLPWRTAEGTGRSPTADDVIPRLPEECSALQDVLESTLAVDPHHRSLNLDSLAQAFDNLNEPTESAGLVVRSDLVNSEEIAKVLPPLDQLASGRIDSRGFERRKFLTGSVAAIGPVLLMGMIWFGYVEKSLIQEFFANFGFVEHPEFDERWQTAQTLRADPNQSLSAVTVAFNRVLEVNPSHEASRQGVVDARNYWKSQVVAAIESDEFSLARAKLNEYVRVYRDDPEIPALLTRLNQQSTASQLLYVHLELQEQHGIEDPETARILIDAYKEVLRLQPGSEQARTQLNAIAQRFSERAIASAKQRDVQSAMEDLEMAVEANPTLSELEQARAEVEQAEDFSEEVATFLEDAGIHRSEGRLVLPPESNAYAIYSHVLKLDPDNQVAQSALAEIDVQVMSSLVEILDERDFVAAEELIEGASNEGFSEESIEEFRGLVGSLNERISQASELCDQAQARFQRGYITQPEDSSALVLLERALDLDPKNLRAEDLLKRCANRVATVAREAYEAGLLEDSRKYLDIAIATGRAEPEWFDWYQDWFQTEAYVDDSSETEGE